MQLTVDTSSKSIGSVDSFSMNYFLSIKRSAKENGIFEFLNKEKIIQISCSEVMVMTAKKPKIKHDILSQKSIGLPSSLLARRLMNKS
mmetsp:Transcript_22446/g.19939  ORF Transcript_22446/g.19939 Transcript_22446/m.19939 type:complete len:88 (+) Transcript_22446:198-461(+)